MILMPTVPARASPRPPTLNAPSTASPTMIHTPRHPRLMIVLLLPSGYLETRTQALHLTPVPARRRPGRPPPEDCTEPLRSRTVDPNRIDRSPARIFFAPSTRFC